LHAQPSERLQLLLFSRGLFPPESLPDVAVAFAAAAFAASFGNLGVHVRVQLGIGIIAGLLLHLQVRLGRSVLLKS